MAEMTTLTATIYRRYQTVLAPGFGGVTPGITARFEVFYDERFPKMAVSSRLVFVRLDSVLMGISGTLLPD